MTRSTPLPPFLLGLRPARLLTACQLVAPTGIASHPTTNETTPPLMIALLCNRCPLSGRRHLQRGSHLPLNLNSLRLSHQALTVPRSHHRHHRSMVVAVYPALRLTRRLLTTPPQSLLMPPPDTTNTTRAAHHHLTLPTLPYPPTLPPLQYSRQPLPPRTALPYIPRPAATHHTLCLPLTRPPRTPPRVAFTRLLRATRPRLQM